MSPGDPPVLWCCARPVTLGRIVNTSRTQRQRGVCPACGWAHTVTSRAAVASVTVTEPYDDDEPCDPDAPF